MILNIVLQEFMNLDETRRGQKHNIDTSFLYHNFYVN